MNEVEIRRLLLDNHVTRAYFGGVLAHDELCMVKPSKPVFYIVNTDISTGYGKHWTCKLLSNNGVSEYFNSLGQSPDTYDKDFYNFLVVNGPRYTYNCERTQAHKTSTSGQFCIYFAYHRCKEYTFEKIMNSFDSENILNNELKVRMFMNREMYKN